MKTKTALISMVLAGTMASGVPSKADQMQERILVSGLLSSPQISMDGNNLVYTAYNQWPPGSILPQIRRYNFNENKTYLVNSSFSGTDLSISENKIAWTGYYGISVTDWVNGTTKLIAPNSGDFKNVNPKIFENTLVYNLPFSYNNNTYFNVVLHDLNTGLESILSNPLNNGIYDTLYARSFDGNRVLYENISWIIPPTNSGSKGLINSKNIFVKDLSNQSSTITLPVMDQNTIQDFQMSGNKVVFSRYDLYQNEMGLNPSIWEYNLQTQEFTKIIPSNNFPMGEPIIYKNSLAWEQADPTGNLNQPYTYSIHILEPIPEPSSLGLIALGSVGLLARRRKNG